MAFEPAVVRPSRRHHPFRGDEQGAHFSSDEGVRGRVESWKGKINEESAVTLSEPGVYMYQCTPHLGMA